MVYKALGETPKERAKYYRELFISHIEGNRIKQMRDATNKGMALGNDRFKESVETLASRRARPLKRGPKPKVIG